MRKLLILIFVFATSYCFSQNEKLIGTWETSKGNLKIIKKFNQENCLTEFYMKEFNAKTQELETKYTIENGKLIHTWKTIKGKGKFENKTESFKIEFLSDSLVKLTAKGNEIFEYRKTSTEIPYTSIRKNNTFLSDNFGIGCISDTLNNSEGYMNCLCFEEINFNTTIEEFINKFGEPARVMDNSDGSKYYIFILSKPKETFSYIAVQKLNNETIALQLTGKDNKIPFSFSTIKLGDYNTFVQQRLGSNFKESKVGEINGFMWDYNPFPFSIEFVDQRVYSIRLSKK